MGDDMRQERVWAENRDAQRLLSESYFSRIIRATKTESPIEFYYRVKVDDYLTVTIGEWGGYFIQIMPKIFNDRLVMTPFTCSRVYDYGWCFPKGAAAGLAALAWNPQAHGEPVGYIKRVSGKRMAGQKALGYLG